MVKIKIKNMDEDTKHKLIQENEKLNLNKKNKN